MMEKILNFFNLPFVEAILTTIAILLLNKTKNIIKGRPIKNIWDQFIVKDKINLIFPSFVQSKFNIPFLNTESRIPKNVKLLPLAEGFAISEMVRVLKKIYPKKEIAFHESDSYSDKTSSFISIGGPSVNRITHILLNIQKIDKYFKIVYPDHYAIDRLDNVEYHAQEESESIVNDFGFIFFTENPFNKDAKVCIVCGVWANGTNSAIQALISSKKLQKQIKKEMKSKKNFIFITKSNVSGNVTGKPVLVKSRQIFPN